jgi:glycosyltransferase involved in cell wall biosynthesis
VGLRVIINDGRHHKLDPAGGDDRPRGGIGTALLALSTGLAARGHEVHVFAPVRAPVQVDGVDFRDRSTLASFTRAKPPDVLILVPELLPLLMPVEARARVVWSGNAHTGGDCALAVPWTWAPQLGDRGTRARLYPIRLLHPYVDRLVMKSRWQAGYVTETQGVPAEKVAVVYNGVPLGLFRGPDPQRQDRRLIYTSQARRGLPVLLEMLPKIREAVPGTELHVFGYEYSKDARASGSAPTEQPGVVWRGTATKVDLARELRSATLMTYPSTFKETFCTSVAEAQAAGLPVVATNYAALADRVSDGVDGFLIPGPAGEPASREAFVQAVTKLLLDEELRRRLGAAAAAKAFHDYDWDRILDQWEALLVEVAANDAGEPAIDPPLDFLDPSLLRLQDKGATANVPPDLADRWLREEWASYGFDPAEMPGLPVRR